jgi:hypothetical protein
MRITRLLLAATLMIIMVAGASAQDKRGTGLGVIFGNPTGLSFKTWVGSNKAIDAAAAWSFRNDGSLKVQADMLWQNFDWIDARWPVYYGLGAVVGIGNDFRLGARVPIGISHLFESAPLDVFLEVVPRLDLIPDTKFRADAAIGIRYYFGRSN